MYMPWNQNRLNDQIYSGCNLGQCLKWGWMFLSLIGFYFLVAFLKHWSFIHLWTINNKWSHDDNINFTMFFFFVFLFFNLTLGYFFYFSNFFAVSAVCGEWVCGGAEEMCWFSLLGLLATDTGINRVICTHYNLHTHTRTHTQTHKHTHAHAQTHTRTQKHPYAQAHTRTHT